MKFEEWLEIDNVELISMSGNRMRSTPVNLWKNDNLLAHECYARMIYFNENGLNHITKIGLLYDIYRGINGHQISLFVSDEDFIKNFTLLCEKYNLSPTINDIIQCVAMDFTEDKDQEYLNRAILILGHKHISEAFKTLLFSSLL